MSLGYKSDIENAMYQALKYSFPDIKNLKVENGTISFSEGKYTKDQVEDKIKEIQNTKP